MGVYKKAVITEAGEALAARAVSGEVTIQFSHAGTSSYAYSEGTNLKKLTELQDVKQTVIPSNVQIANDTLISIRSMFDNSEITQEYLIQNVGIYASDGETEILFAVCQATTPDQMPAFNGVAPSSFIYNVQISIAQADQLSISISTAGTATVQDVLDLEKKMEEKKLDSSGGDASDTVASVEEPNSEEEKYPDIGSKGSMKNILGNLYRWVKILKADKVDSAGGDTAETVISAFEAPSENFPVPAVKEKAKTRWGKVKKFCEDFKAWMTGVCLLGHIVNNCVTNNPNLPLSAAQGKALMDLYTVLNTKQNEADRNIELLTTGISPKDNDILNWLIADGHRRTIWKIKGSSMVGAPNNTSEWCCLNFLENTKSRGIAICFEYGGTAVKYRSYFKENGGVKWHGPDWVDIHS